MKKASVILFSALVSFFPIWSIVICGWIEQGMHRYASSAFEPMVLLIPVVSYILTGILCAAIACIKKPYYREKSIFIAHIASLVLAIVLVVAQIGVALGWFYFNAQINRFIENDFSSVEFICLTVGFISFTAIRAIILFMKKKT